jgi:hypothetical protein
LHNYYINETLENKEVENILSGIMESDVRHLLHRVVRFNKRKENKNNNESLDIDIVTLNSNDIQDSPLVGGGHFHHCPRRNRTNDTDEVIPMDMMLESVCKQHVVWYVNLGNNNIN